MRKLRSELDQALAGKARPAVSVLRAGGLGDTLLVLSAVQILLSEVPRAQVTLVGSAWAERLRPLLSCDVRVRRFDAAQLSRWFRPRLKQDESGLLSAADAVILYSSGRADVLEENARRLCPGQVLVHPLGPPEGVHAATHFARAVAEVGRTEDVPIPALRAPERLAGWAAGWLRARLPAQVAPLALHPGSGGGRKCWPPERFAELARRLERPCIVLEGPADRDPCRRVLERLPQAASVRGLKLHQVAALLTRSALLVCNDSGVGHLAAALGVATVPVFGRTDPRTWSPRGPAVSVVPPASDAADGWPSVDQVLKAARRLQARQA